MIVIGGVSEPARFEEEVLGMKNDGCRLEGLIVVWEIFFVAEESLDDERLTGRVPFNGPLWLPAKNSDEKKKQYTITKGTFA